MHIGIVILIQVILLAVQGSSYILIQKFQRKCHQMERKLDKRIPLVSEAVFLYILWYPLIAVYPVYLYALNWEFYGHYIAAIVIDILVSLLIYVLYPTTFCRPEAPVQKFSGKILRLLYFADYKGLNCMPSMHCSQCFIIMLISWSAWSKGGLPVPAAAAITILSSAIVLATALTKQHVVIDILTAVPVGAGAYFLSGFLMRYLIYDFYFLLN